MSVLDKVGAQLGKKLGPLPVWGWGVIGAAGIWVVRSMGGSKPRPARTSSGIGRTSLGSGSGSSLPGSYPPPISPAFGAPSTPLSVQTPGYSISGAGSDVLELLKDFTYVGVNEQPTEVQQSTFNKPSPTAVRYALYWPSSPGVYVGVYASRLAASQAAQRMDPKGAAWAGINPATGKPYPGSGMSITEI